MLTLEHMLQINRICTFLKKNKNWIWTMNSIVNVEIKWRVLIIIHWGVEFKYNSNSSQPKPIFFLSSSSSSSLFLHGAVNKGGIFFFYLLIIIIIILSGDIAMRKEVGSSCFI